MIRVEGVTKRYGAHTAVDHVTFTAEPGRVTGFLGPNGAGKSTTMRVIVGLTPPTTGAARVLGRRFTDLPNPGLDVGVLSVLTVVTLRQSYAGADAGAAAGLTVAGDAFLRLQEWTFGLGPSFVVGVGNGVILGYLMYRSRLVPRKLAVLGLVGGPLIILSGAAAMVGAIELDGTWQVLAAAPEFFWELGLGIYLIVKGFRPSPVTAGMDDER